MSKSWTTMNMTMPCCVLTACVMLRCQVRLKDIVDYVTGIIAHNAVLASLDSCLPQLLASAAADFALQAKAAVQRASAHTDSQASNAGSSKAGVTDHTRMCISALSEEVLESSVTKVSVHTAIFSVHSPSHCCQHCCPILPPLCCSWY